MRVLSFGHIPLSEGGRQSSGLSNVIYQIAFHCAQQEVIDVILAATDVFVKEQKRGPLTVLGWTKGLLIRYALFHAGKALRILYWAIKSKKKYPALVSVMGLFLKSVFLDYAIRKVHPNVVHMHGAQSVLYFTLIPRQVKLVVTLHGNVGHDDNILHYEIHSKMEEAICSSQRIDILCAISSTIPVIFRKMYGEIRPKVKVILNAYDNQVFKYINPKEHSKLTLCTIASFSKLKGQERVIDALKLCHCNYSYKCVGHISDPDKELLEIKARDIDFEWLGIKKPYEIRELLAECDYMILPSSSEGFGLVYLEAIACGVPVIIPNNLPLALEGNILNDKNAIRIKGYDVDAIVSVLPSLAKRKWNRLDVSKSVTPYTWDSVAKKYCEIYLSYQ